MCVRTCVCVHASVCGGGEGVLIHPKFFHFWGHIRACRALLSFHLLTTASGHRVTTQLSAQRRTGSPPERHKHFNNSFSTSILTNSWGVRGRGSASLVGGGANCDATLRPPKTTASCAQREGVHATGQAVAVLSSRQAASSKGVCPLGACVPTAVGSGHQESVLVHSVHISCPVGL